MFVKHKLSVYEREKEINKVVYLLKKIFKIVFFAGKLQMESQKIKPMFIKTLKSWGLSN